MISPRAIWRSHRVSPWPHRPALRRPVLPAMWRKLQPTHALWLAVWAPWWVGNELPPPPPPRSTEPAMTDVPEGSAGDWFLDTLDDLKFRFGLAWTAALILRGAWIGGVVGIIWMLLALAGAASSPSIQALVTLVVVGIVAGVVLRMFHRPRYAAIAALLERAFDLRSRLSTAVASLRYGAHRSGSLHPIQLADAANALDRARSQLRPIHWVPVREIFIGFIVAIAMLLLLVAQRPEGDIPAVSQLGVPAFVPVSERLAAVEQQAPPPDLPDPATLQEVEDLSRASNQARQDLEAIAGALDSNPVTNPVAEAIAGEDYPGANERLDAASDEVMNLPQADRESLADELDEAANRVSEDNPELASSARAASDDVRSGEDTGALDDLGDEIERTGESVISQQASGGELTEMQGGEQGGGQSGATGDQASQPPGQSQPGAQGADAPSASGGDPGSGMQASGGVTSGEEGGQGAEGGEPGQQDGQPGSAENGAAGSESEGDPVGGSGQSSREQGAETGSTEQGSGSTSGGSDDGTSSQGSGAGSGEADAENPESEGGAGGGGETEADDETPDAGQGEAGDPPTGGQQDGASGQTAITGGSSSIQLPGTSGERVRSGSDIGASSVGSGGGVGAASGDSTQGVSGSSGPDPNSVPEEWRTIVEDYFREGGAP